MVKYAELSEKEREVIDRSRRVRAAKHSTEMEGLSVSPETLADADEYVVGNISSAELMARARARYGLD